MAEKVASIMASVGLDASDFNRGAAGLGGSLSELIDMISGLNPALAVSMGLLTAAAGALTEAGKAAEESALADAKLAAVIKATGSAAGLTADEIDDMTAAMSQQTAIDDELLKSSASLLLTFRNIGEETFPRAMQAVADLSTMFGGLESSAVQVGKALNDPIAGITALQRVGVTFSDEQKTQIENFVEVNDLASAQAVILAEVEAQVGGTAAAMAAASDQSNRLAIAYGNYMEQIGQGVLPAQRSWNAFWADYLDGQAKGMEATRQFAELVQRPINLQYDAQAIERFAKDMERGAAMTARYSYMLQDDLVPAIEETTEAMYNEADAMDAVQAGLSGEYVGIVEDLASANEDFAERTAELNEELAQAVSWYGENSTQANDLRDALADVADEQARAADNASRATREMIFQNVAAKASADVQLELARSMGLLSEADYNIAKATEAIVDQGQVDIVDPDEVGQLNELAKVIDGLRNKNIEITFDALMSGVKLLDSAAISAMIAGQVVAEVKYQVANGLVEMQ